MLWYHHCQARAQFRTCFSRQTNAICMCYALYSKRLKHILYWACTLSIYKGALQVRIATAYRACTTGCIYAIVRYQHQVSYLYNMSLECALELSGSQLFQPLEAMCSLPSSDLASSSHASGLELEAFCSKHIYDAKDALSSSFGPVLPCRPTALGTASMPKQQPTAQK